jgi:hypothetical protein
MPSSLTIIAISCSRETFLQAVLDVVVCGHEKVIVRLRSEASTVAAFVFAWVPGQFFLQELLDAGRVTRVFWGNHVRLQTAYRVI